MKTKFFYLLAVLMLLFTACRKSSLSDIELDDPSILKVYAKVGKYTNLDSTVIESHVFNLRIKDKTDHSIELKKGQVLCNDVSMESFTDLFGPYYKVPKDSLTVTDNTLYNFIVELADGGQYSSNVFVDDSYLKLLEAPSSWIWTAGDSLTISWNNPNNEYTTQLSWYLTLLDSVLAGDKPRSGGFDVSASNIYKFPPSFFTNEYGENRVQKLRINLESEKEGQLNDNFYSGSIVARFIFIKEIAIE